MVVEVYTPSGSWSSYPPHKHDVHRFDAGGRLIEAYPIVPLTQNLTIVVGILSYDGTLHFGLFADRDAVPDVDHLAACIDDAFAELAKTARGESDPASASGAGPTTEGVHS